MTERQLEPALPDRPLPADVRSRLVAIAAELMSRRPLAELPAGVRRFARFTPAKRLRLGASEIAAALENDGSFRTSVADVVADSSPELVDQVRAGTVSPVADPVDVAVIAYLFRPDGWGQLLDRASQTLADQQQARSSEGELDRLRAELARATESGAALARDREAARAAVKVAAGELSEQTADLRRRLREEQAELRAARRTVDQLRAELATVREEQSRAGTADASELRRARGRIAALEGELESGRRSARADRDHDEARLWVLLETITSAAGGLRRELDLRNPGVRPADSVDARDSGVANRPSTVDGSLLERLLDGGHVHLIVDGYNLSKTGYGSLALADQRSRLVSSLGALAARTGVEVTVAFDGTTAPPGAVASLPTPRGVRVLFSVNAQLADDLIRELLLAEPPGRTVLVASSDGAVAASARAAGAWSTSALVLLGKLERS